MPINSINELIAAAKQALAIFKNGTRATTISAWFTTFDLAGNPGGGVLAGTSTTQGVVPTDATVGTLPINAFGVGSKGYISQIEFGSNIACRMKLFDMVFKAGAYAFTGGTTTLSAQPSYTSRMPDGSFSGTQIWFEVSTGFATGNSWQVQITYTNQDGVSGRSTVILPPTAAAGLTAGRLYQLALQAGDSGVQSINSVIVTNGGTAMTAGAFNVLVLRPLWSGRCKVNNDGETHDWARTGMPEVFADSALILAIASDSTGIGVPELEMTIANG